MMERLGAALGTDPNSLKCVAMVLIAGAMMWPHRHAGLLYWSVRSLFTLAIAMCFPRFRAAAKEAVAHGVTLLGAGGARDDDGAAAAAAPPKRRKAGGQSARKPAGRKPAPSSSPAAARPRRAAGASAASASGSLSLAEIKEGSGLDHEEFLQVWQQKHPQVQRWLRAGQGSDEDEDEDDESQQDALSDASNRPQQVRTTQPRPA